MRFQLLLAGTLLLAGCSANHASSAFPVSQSAADSALDDSATVYVQASVGEQCELSDEERTFEYSSNRLTDADSHAVARLADCLRDGPLAARLVQIVTACATTEVLCASETTVTNALVERRVARSRISINRVACEGLRLCGSRHVSVALVSPRQ